MSNGDGQDKKGIDKLLIEVCRFLVRLKDSTVKPRIEGTKKERILALLCHFIPSPRLRGRRGVATETPYAYLYET